MSKLSLRLSNLVGFVLVILGRRKRIVKTCFAFSFPYNYVTSALEMGEGRIKVNVK